MRYSTEFALFVIKLCSFVLVLIIGLKFFSLVIPFVTIPKISNFIALFHLHHLNQITNLIALVK